MFSNLRADTFASITITLYRAGRPNSVDKALTEKEVNDVHDLVRRKLVTELACPSGE